MKRLSSLAIILSLFLAGCAGLEKLPDDKFEELSNRTIDAPIEKVYDAAIATLLDEGYTIESESESMRYLNTGWKELAGHDPVESMAGQLNTRVILNFFDNGERTGVEYKLFARNTSRNSGDGSRVKVTFLEERAKNFWDTLTQNLTQARN